MSTLKPTTAERGGIRPSLRPPVHDSLENRSRRTKRAFGISSAIRPRMESEPRNSVSCRPRARSSRSVKTCPRSGSAQSWISSTPTKSAPISSGIASTVQIQYCARGGAIFSSPVTSAATEGPRSATTLS